MVSPIEKKEILGEFLKLANVELEGKDKDKFIKTIEKVGKLESGSKILQRFITRGKPITIKKGNTDGYLGGVISLESTTSSFILDCSDPERNVLKRMPRSLTFLHELLHADHDNADSKALWDRRYAESSIPNMSNQEEELTVTGKVLGTNIVDDLSEKVVAEELGLYPRNDHRVVVFEKMLKKKLENQIISQIKVTDSPEMEEQTLGVSFGDISWDKPPADLGDLVMRTRDLELYKSLLELGWEPSVKTLAGAFSAFRKTLSQHPALEDIMTRLKKTEACVLNDAINLSRGKESIDFTDEFVTCLVELGFEMDSTTLQCAFEKKMYPDTIAFLIEKNVEVNSNAFESAIRNGYSSFEIESFFSKFDFQVDQLIYAINAKAEAGIIELLAEKISNLGSEVFEYAIEHGCGICVLDSFIENGIKIEEKHIVLAKKDNIKRFLERKFKEQQLRNSDES